MNILLVLSSAKSRLLRSKVEERLSRDPINRRKSLFPNFHSLSSHVRNKVQGVSPGVRDQHIHLYVNWILGRYASGSISLKNIKKIIPALKEYHVLRERKQLSNADMNLGSIQNLDDLQNLLDRYGAETGNTGESAQHYFNTGQAELIYDGPDIRIIAPKSIESSCFFGVDKWCTSRRDFAYNTFLHHTSHGADVYYVTFKGITDKRNRMVALSRLDNFLDTRYNWVEAYDARNKGLSLDQVRGMLSRYPKLKKIYKNAKPFAPFTEEGQLMIVEKHPRFLEIIMNHLGEPPESVMIEAVRNDPEMIRVVPRDRQREIRRLAAL